MRVSGEEAALRLAGRVGLYRDDFNAHKRPDSSRPQAARSRVATRVSGEEAGIARRCSAPIINIAANGDKRRAAARVDGET